MKGRTSITIVTMLVLLSCTWTPCSGFFIETLTSRIEEVAGTIFWEVIKLIIEGPTGLVIRALTYDYFGIQDALWHLGWWGLDKGIKKVGTVASATLWWGTTKTLDKFYDAWKWLFNTTVKGIVGGAKNAANFAKGAVGISTALEKLGKLKEEKILKKTDTKTSTAKPDEVNITLAIGRHIDDSNNYASSVELQGLMTTLEEAFMTASHYDQHLCLPLVLCTIYADNPSLQTAQETKLASLFKLLLDVKPPPPWAYQNLQGAQLGIDSTDKQNKRICRKAFPRCPYPVQVLRSLMSFVLESSSLRTFISENQDYFVH